MHDSGLDKVWHPESPEPHKAEGCSWQHTPNRKIVCGKRHAPSSRWHFFGWHVTNTQHVSLLRKIAFNFASRMSKLVLVSIGNYTRIIDHWMVKFLELVTLGIGLVMVLKQSITTGPLMNLNRSLFPKVATVYQSASSWTATTTVVWSVWSSRATDDLSASSRTIKSSTDCVETSALIFHQKY